MKIFYFGCVREAGHYMFDHNLRTQWDVLDTNPWKYEVDSGLCPKGPEIQGRALVHHKDGWTALSFWDRSVDKRGKCNSNFLAEGTFTFAQMWEYAQKYFPSITGRFTFPVVEAI
jgi:hypothetical protein